MTTAAQNSARSVPDPRPTDSVAPPSRRGIAILFVGLMVGVLLAALDQTTTSAAITTIADDLHGPDQMTGVITAYLITLTISTLLYGRLSDSFGRKAFYTSAVVIFLIGSIACAVTNSMYLLTAFRAVAGLGAGGLIALALAALGDVMPPRRHARYQGYVLAVFGCGIVFGPVLGEFLAGQPRILRLAGWRWIFLGNVPLAILALLMVARMLNPSVPRQARRIDWLGAAALAVCLVPLLIVVEQGQQWGWTSAQAVLCYGIGSAGLALFLLVEWFMRDAALIPLRVFRNSTFSLASGANFLIGLGMFGGLVTIPLYLQIVKDASPARVGLLVLPLVAGLVLASVFSGYIAEQTGQYKAFPLLGAALMIAGLLLLDQIDIQSDVWRTDIRTFVFGFGVGSCLHPLLVATQNSLPATNLGLASSCATLFRQMGSTLGIAVFVPVLSSTFATTLGRGFHRFGPIRGFWGALRDPDVLANPANATAVRLLRSAGSGQAGDTAASVLRNPSLLHNVDPRLLRPFQFGFSESLHSVLLIAAAVVAVAFLLTLFMREVPLLAQRETQARMGVDNSAAKTISTKMPAVRARAERIGHDLSAGAPDGPAWASTAAVYPQRTRAHPRADQGSDGEVQGNGQVPAAALATVTTAAAGAAPMASVSEGFVPPQREDMPIHGRVRRADGKVISAAALTLIDPSGRQVGRGVSDNDGGYRLSAPTAGTYVLIASASAHQPQASMVTVSTGPVAVDVVLTGTSSVAGTVSVAGRGPIAGATATLADNRGEVVGSQFTNSVGRYVFPELVSGTYTLVVSADACRPAAMSVVVPGTGETVQDVELVGGARLHGIARVAGGRVVADARITLLDRAGNLLGVTTTDEAGEYSFADLPEGDYTVIASGYPPVASVLRVAGGEFGEHDVRLGYPSD